MAYRRPKQITLSNVDEVRANEPDRPVPRYLRNRPLGKTWPPWAPHPLAIRITLEASGLEMEEFCKRVDCDRTRIEGWLYGKSWPSPYHVEKLREHFPEILFRAMQCAERFEYEKASSPKAENALAKKTLRRNMAPYQPPNIQVQAAKHMLDRNLGLPVAPSVVVNSTVTEFEALKKKYGSRVLPPEYVEQMKKAGYYKDPDADSPRKSPDLPAASEAARLASPSPEDQARDDREPSRENRVDGGGNRDAGHGDRPAVHR
jgi:transcriptional regulator with XRE-family HTH domain